MLKKAKREYYNNIDIKLLNDNRKFWKCIKPLFSNKQIRLSKACEHDVAICSDKTIAEIFNDFFINTTNLTLGGVMETNKNESNTFEDDLNTIFELYEYHLSVIKIKEKLRIENKFAFVTMSTTDIMQEISRLEENKITANGDIPVKLLKICSDIIAPFLKNANDDTIKTSKFPSGLKLVDVIPAHKKDDATKKTPN